MTESTNNTTPKPRAFISYSWTSPEHINRVVSLAERLVGDGVDVVLDQWDLKEGHDKIVFMEKMVTDTTVNKVIVVSDRRYAEKADGREGGVGTESQIISKEVYERTEQDKFIPLVFEFDSKGQACLPTFLKSRIYIDFSSVQQSADNYERLLRTLFNKPAQQKPKLGKPPAYLSQETTTFSPNRSSLDMFIRALHEDKSSYKALAIEYLERFHSGLEEFKIDLPPKKLEEEFLRVFHDMLHARNELLEFYKEAFSFKDDYDLMEIIIEFLEKTLNYNYRPIDVTSWDETWFENFKIFNYESFVYLIAILIKYKRYSLIDNLLSHGYYVEAAARDYNHAIHPFTIFWSDSEILRIQNERLKSKKISPLAELIKKRATLSFLSFDEFIQADIVLLLRSLLDDDDYTKWYPRTMIFAGWSRALPLFARAESEKGFASISQMLSNINRAELKLKIDNATKGVMRETLARLGFYTRISLHALINYKNIFKE